MTNSMIYNITTTASITALEKAALIDLPTYVSLIAVTSGVVPRYNKYVNGQDVDLSALPSFMASVGKIVYGSSCSALAYFMRSATNQITDKVFEVNKDACEQEFNSLKSFVTGNGFLPEVEISSECVYKAVGSSIGGGVSGATKYYLTSQDMLIGALNQGLYEIIDLSKDVRDLIYPVAIPLETLDGLGQGFMSIEGVDLYYGSKLLLATLEGFQASIAVAVSVDALYVPYLEGKAASTQEEEVDTMLIDGEELNICSVESYLDLADFNSVCLAA
jgi:hypothetical protein